MKTYVLICLIGLATMCFGAMITFGPDAQETVHTGLDGTLVGMGGLLLLVIGVLVRISDLLVEIRDRLPIKK